VSPGYGIVISPLKLGYSMRNGASIQQVVQLSVAYPKILGPRRALTPLLVSFAMAFLGPQLQAGTIQFSTTIALDPSFLHTVPSIFYLQEFSASPTFPVHAGDVITGIITFSNGSLSVVNHAGDIAFEDMSFLVADFMVEDPLTQWSQDLQVLGLTGNSGFSNPVHMGTSFGGAVVGADLVTQAAQDFTFTGFAYTLNVSSVALGNQEITAPFYFSSLAIASDAITVNINSVPEPNSSALVFCGLSLVGLAAIRWSRRVR
jgi:hypothetical protein